MQIRKIVKTSVAALFVAILAACSSISTGTITSKSFEPEHTTQSTSCTYVGKIIICTPIFIHHDDAWKFDIKDGEDTGWVYVTEEEYNFYSVGDYYPA